MQVTVSYLMCVNAVFEIPELNFTISSCMFIMTTATYRLGQGLHTLLHALTPKT